jgi:hypothetical protein
MPETSVAAGYSIPVEMIMQTNKDIYAKKHGRHLILKSRKIGIDPKVMEKLPHTFFVSPKFICGAKKKPAIKATKATRSKA